MNIIKSIVYSCLLIALLSNIVSDDTQQLLFYVYLSFIYFDCKDHNIRSLIVILAGIEFIFFEFDYVIYIVSKYYIDTGPIIGDIILNIIILMNMLCLMFSIFYRCELMESLSRIFNLKSCDYLPTKADIVQIYVVRMILLVHITFFVTHMFLIYKLINANSMACDHIYAVIKSYGLVYVDLTEKMEILRYFAIVIVLSPWSKQINKNSPYFKMKM